MDKLELFQLYVLLEKYEKELTRNDIYIMIRIKECVRESLKEKDVRIMEY